MKLENLKEQNELKGKPIKYPIGTEVRIKKRTTSMGRVGIVVAEHKGYPRNWHIVKLHGEEIMYDEHEIEGIS